MTNGSIIEPLVHTHNHQGDGSSHVVISLVTSRVFHLRGYTHLNWPLWSSTWKFPIYKNKILDFAQNFFGSKLKRNNTASRIHYVYIHAGAVSNFFVAIMADVWRQKQIRCQKYKETIMRGHDRHNTTILWITHNMSTTCFGQHHFWPSSGWIQLSEKTTQYIIWYGITISNFEVRHPRCVGSIPKNFCVLHIQSNTTIFLVMNRE